MKLCFDSTEDLSKALLDAESAHRDFERQIGETHNPWTTGWYAKYIVDQKNLLLGHSSPWPYTANKYVQPAIDATAWIKSPLSNDEILRINEAVHLKNLEQDLRNEDPTEEVIQTSVEDVAVDYA